jgi:hypothetical protein
MSQQSLFCQEIEIEGLFCHVCKAEPPCKTCDYLIPTRELHKWCDEVIEFYRESKKTSGSIVTPDEALQSETFEEISNV